MSFSDFPNTPQHEMNTNLTASYRNPNENENNPNYQTIPLENVRFNLTIGNSKPIENKNESQRYLGKHKRMITNNKKEVRTIMN